MSYLRSNFVAIHLLSHEAAWAAKIPLSFMPEISPIVTDLRNWYYPWLYFATWNQNFCENRSLIWTWFEIAKSIRINSYLKLDISIDKISTKVNCYFLVKATWMWMVHVCVDRIYIEIEYMYVYMYNFCDRNWMCVYVYVYIYLHVYVQFLQQTWSN